MADTKPRRKRTHSAALKAEVLAACAEPSASVAAVALAHGLNTNLVHKWRRRAKQAAEKPLSVTTAKLLLPPGSQFVALPMAATEIRIEIRRGASSVAVHWPVSAASECAAWLGAWLR